MGGIIGTARNRIIVQSRGNDHYRLVMELLEKDGIIESSFSSLQNSGKLGYASSKLGNK